MIEKMKLVWANGDLSHLDAFLKACCMQGDFDPCPATQYMSSSMGYISLNEENPYTATQTRIEAMSKEIGMPLPKADHHTPVLDADASAYLDDLNSKFTRLHAEHDSLMEQKRICEEGISQYSHFVGLKVNMDELIMDFYFCDKQLRIHLEQQIEDLSKDDYWTIMCQNTSHFFPLLRNHQHSMLEEWMIQYPMLRTLIEELQLDIV